MRQSAESVGRLLRDRFDPLLQDIVEQEFESLVVGDEDEAEHGHDHAAGGDS